MFTNFHDDFIPKTEDINDKRIMRRKMKIDKFRQITRHLRSNAKCKAVHYYICHKILTGDTRKIFVSNVRPSTSLTRRAS